jgi:photosystem II stability/assembly factor-like uncharacterized protein
MNIQVKIQKGWHILFVLRDLLLFLTLCTPFVSCQKFEKAHSITSLNLQESGAIRSIQGIDHQTFLISGGTRFEYGFLYRCYWNGILSCDKIVHPFDQSGFSCMDMNINVSNQVIICSYGGQMYAGNASLDNWELAQQNSYAAFECCAIFDNGKIIIGGGIDRNKGFICRSSSNWWEISCDSIEIKIMGLHINSAGYVLGAAEGTVLISKDSALTFLPSQPKGDYFRRFSFPDQDTGFVCGSFGAVWKTLDGGLSWAEMKKTRASDKGSLILDLDFISAEIGVLGGLGGKIWYTYDGGNSWKKLQIDAGNDVFSIKMLSTKSVLIGSINGQLLIINLPTE